MKYTFFIEGGENVGKTTTIKQFKSCEFVDKLSTYRLSFSKYPSYRIAKYMDESNKKLKELLKEEDIVSYTELSADMINTILKDMEYSFINNSDVETKFKIFEDITNVADRGPLSTYIYQYKTLLKAQDINIDTIEDERNNLILFFLSYVNFMYNQTHYSYPIPSIIILNNNKPNTDPTTDEEKTLSNILELMKSQEFNESIYRISKFKFYSIDTYTEEGKRKTPRTLCKEMLNIINTRISESKDSLI